MFARARIVLVLVHFLAGPSSAARAEPRASGPYPGVAFVAPAAYRPAPWTGFFREEVARLEAETPGRFGVQVIDPTRGFIVGVDAARPYYLASGVKMAFMVEVFRQRAAGTLSFEERLPYTEADIRDGAPRMNRLRRGRTFPIPTLLDWMIRSSDNAASDLLAQRVGIERIVPGLEAEGVHGFTALTRLIDVRRGVFRELDVAADDLTPRQVRTIRWTSIWDPQLRRLERELGKPPRTFDREDLFVAYDRFYATGVNRAPMRAVADLLDRMVRGVLVDSNSSREMLVLMRGARTSTHRILGRLPPGTVVAHKTGSQYERLCDLGVMDLRDGTPLIFTMCVEKAPVPEAEQAVATLARKAWDLAHAERDEALP